eukprot:GFUD01041366.1.p1 GENE.GFUD01041366.1~~GFUD01041366.1.p1  ORF type:complete len:522 (+),score=119.58 GFUD01041366.1:35-1600(+)
MTDLNNSNSSGGDNDSVKAPLERDFYGCYCLKFRIKHGSSVTEDQIYRDFGVHGEVLDVWGAGFVYKEAQNGPVKYSDRLDSEVNVRFRVRRDAKEALTHLRDSYHELTPAISDVLPDNHGLFTISFENKMAIPTNDLFHEFSKYGEIKAITGALYVKMGRVFISYWSKDSSIQAFLNKTERWFLNMRFTFPRCDKDYFGTYCMKFYNTKGTPNYVTEQKVMEDFGQYGEVVDVRGPGLFDVPGDDVYVRYWKKTSAQTALSSLVGKYDCICITPASDIHPDRFGLFTLTFVNRPNVYVSEADAWHIFGQFGPVTSVTGTFGVKTGRVFVAYDEKEAALRAVQTMLVTKQFHLQLAKSCKPTKFPKSVKNYYSAATTWGSTAFPRKRKEREEEWTGEQSKSGRWEEEDNGGDWFKRKDNYVREGLVSTSRKDRKLLEEKQRNLEGAEASYSYRAPLQEKSSGEDRYDDGNWEGSSGFQNGSCRQDVENGNNEICAKNCQELHLTTVPGKAITSVDEPINSQ